MKASWIKKVLLIGIFAILILGLAACSSKKTVDNSENPSDAKAEYKPTYLGSGVGYVIKFENGTKIYDAGDTNLFYDMKAVIGDIFKPDVAILPIGNIFTMDDKLAAKAVEWINPKIAIPDHYASYPLLTETADRFVQLVNEKKNQGLTSAETKVIKPGKEEDVLGVKTLLFGHGSLQFTSPTGTKILVDPWFEANPATPAEYKDANKIDKPDVIILTHGHIDHLVLEELKKLEKDKPVIIAQWELGLYLQKQLSNTVVLMNKGATLTNKDLIKQGVKDRQVVIPEGMEISVVSADHSSGQ